MQSIITFLRRFSLLDYYPVTLVAFLITHFIENKTGVSFLVALPALLLLAYLPGYHLLKFLRMPIAQWHWYGRLAFYFATSIALLATVQFVARPIVPFTINSQIALLIAINTALYILAKLSAEENNITTNVWQRLTALARSSTRVDYLVLLIPVILYIVTLAINPTVDNADSYLEMLQTAVETQIYPQAASRVFFVPLLGIYSYVTQLAPVTIFKLILTLSFYSSLFIAFDYIKRNIHNVQLAWLTYLAVLAPPVILVEVNIVRPQLIVMAFTIPILILLIEALKARNYLYLGVALWFSFIVTGFHELGAVFIVMSILTALPMLWNSLFISKEFNITFKHIIVAAIIFFPYSKLIPIGEIFAPLFRMITYVFSFLSNINWSWWFIDSYTTIDGFNVGWPGIQALHYYLYNGILLIGLMLLLLLATTAKHRVSKNNARAARTIFIPVSYVLVYLAFAELLPRIGLFFIPNRAWPHLMLGLIVCLILFIENNQDILTKRLKQYLVPLFALIIIPGVIGTLYLTYNRVGNVFPEELAAVRYIQNQTPKRSLFISTQNNRDLVMFYAKRDFITVNEEQFPRPITNITDFKTASDRYYREMTIPAAPYSLPEHGVITTEYEGETIIKETKVFTPGITISPKAKLESGTPIFFIYSLRKAHGLNAQREYNKKPVDVDSEPFFQKLRNNNIVYRDNAIVIIRLTNP